MPHLTDEQLQDFQQRLEDAKVAMQALLNQTAENSQPVDLDLPIGRLTRIDAIQSQAMAQMNRHQLEIRLKQVEAALMTFDQGTYGICRRCKDPVNLGRLEILPETPFCVDCQESFEQRR